VALFEPWAKFSFRPFPRPPSVDLEIINDEGLCKSLVALVGCLGAAYVADGLLGVEALGWTVGSAIPR